MDVIEVRISERGKQRENHEIRRLVLETWKKMEVLKDIVLPNAAGDRISADVARLALFRDLYGDLETRVNYKEMGLSQDEKYELMEMIRGWKNIIQMPNREQEGSRKGFLY